MQARRSLFFLSLSAFALFFIGYSFLPQGADEVLYQPRNSASLDGEGGAYYEGAAEYYKDLRQGATPTKLRRAERALSEFSSPQRGALDMDWHSEGPVNQGGRTRSVLHMGSEVWVGGVSGGLWRSTDNGENWKDVSSFNEECVVSTMAQLGNGDIFIGTGSVFERPNGGGSSGFNGRGLYVTTDNGQSFDLVPNTRPDTNNTGQAWSFVNDMVADPSDDNGLWIAHSGGLSYYDASTQNMNTVKNGQFYSIDVSSDGSHVIVSDNSGYIHLSTDGGNNFDNLSVSGPLPVGGSRAEVAIAPSDKDWMYVSMADANEKLGTVQMTKNGGSDWGEIASGNSSSFSPFSVTISNQGFYDQAITVHPDNKKRIVLGGIKLWGFKLDPTQFDPYAGQWSRLATRTGFPASVPFYVHADIHDFEWANNGDFYIGTDGGVFKSEDGLETFVPSSKNFVSTQFYSVEFSPNDQIMGGTQDNGTQYLDRSDRWRYATRVRSGDGFDCEISHLKPSVIFTTVYGNNSPNYIHRSEEGGEGMGPFLSSTDFSQPVDDFYGNMALFEDPNDTLSRDSVAFINERDDSTTIMQGDTLRFQSATAQKEVVTTLWKDSLPHGDTVMLQDPVQSLFAFTAEDGSDEFVYITRDALRLNKPQQNAYKVFDVNNNAVNTYAFSDDGNHLFIGLRGSGDVYRVSGFDSAYSQSGFNNNVTTTPVFNGNGRTCTGISVDHNDPDHVVLSFAGYGGTDKVRESFNATAASPSWNSIWNSSTTNLTGPLASIPVYDVIIERDDPNIILAGTEYGIFATDNGGNTWVHQNKDPIGHAPVFDIEQQRRTWNEGAKNPGHIYVGSHGRGLFKNDELEDIKEHPELDGGGAAASVSVNVYPNPASDRAFISLSEDTDQEFDIALYDLNGKKVKSIPSLRLRDGKEQAIQVADLEEGIYFVQARGQDLQKSAKLVIRR